MTSDNDSGSSPPALSNSTVTMSRWASYSANELHRIVCDSASQLTALSQKGHAELRQRLLPALQEVRHRLRKGETIDGHDTIKEYLAAIGLSEGVIRQWEFRFREKELKELGFEVDAAPAVEDEAPSDEELQAMAEEAGEATAPLPKKEYAPNTRGSHKVLQELAAQVQAKYGEGTCSVMPMPDGSPINNGVVLLTIPVSVTRAQTLLKESL